MPQRNRLPRNGLEYVVASFRQESTDQRRTLGNEERMRQFQMAPPRSRDYDIYVHNLLI
jgi:hypothetical protein